VVTLACTICGAPSFAKLRVEIAAGAGTYLVCERPACIAEATDRAADNLWNAAKQNAAKLRERVVIDVETYPQGLP
jgi:hypothetical protein